MFLHLKNVLKVLCYTFNVKCELERDLARDTKHKMSQTEQVN